METEIGGKSLWQDVLIATADTTGRTRGKIIPVATTMTPGLPPVNTMMSRKEKIMKKCNCEECIHFMMDTTDDVACCNCCEDGSFFEECKDEYTLADLGNNWW